MLHSFRHDDPLFRLRSLVASKGMATDDQTSFKNISFEDISFEDISFEDISFKDISFEDISFEDISLEDIYFEGISLKELGSFARTCNASKWEADI